MTTITKLDAARIQLDAAVEHFFSGNYVCTIALAGGAEEMLSFFLTRSGQQGIGDMVREAHEQLAGKRISDGDFKFQVWHRLRNWLKHAKRDPDGTMTIQQEDAVRALLAGIGAYDALTREYRPESFNRFASYWHSIMYEFSGVPPERCD